MTTETKGLLRMGAQDSHLDFHTAPELSTNMLVWAYIYICPHKHICIEVLTVLIYTVLHVLSLFLS